MSAFGALPEGERRGVVPAFAFKLTTLKPSPKGLYGSLCTNADPKGLLWRSLARLAVEFNVSRRQVQRWLNDLEAHGLVVRVGKVGRSEKFMVVRDPAGLNWARLKNLKAVTGRRASATPNGKEGARRKWEASSATQMSDKPDVDVTLSETPMSPEHNLLNTTALTKEDARQESRGAEKYRPARASFGLKRLHRGPNDEAIQMALAQIAPVLGGWEALAATSPPELTALIAQHLGVTFPVAEVASCLEVPTVPQTGRG